MIKGKNKQEPQSTDFNVAELKSIADGFQAYLTDKRQNDNTANTKTDQDIAQLDADIIQRELNLDVVDVMDNYAKLFSQTSKDSVVSALPILLRLRGKPYSLSDHYPMEPLFKTQQPVQFLLKSGRQVSKSTCLSAAGVIQSSANPFFNSLFVTPLFEQCRRFSSNYVRPFITDSPIYEHLVDYNCEQNVLQRTFKNRATMFFQYCLKDADRVRGIAADCVTLDEVQDIDWDLVPIVLETMSASKWSLFRAAGTPKTLDNTIERLWEKSSQGEWVTRCTACNHFNIACVSQDLLKMIGKETIVCAKCARPINPRPAAHPSPELRGTGFWLHTYPDKATEFPGYHTPQVIFPMHFANAYKWKLLREKMDTTKTPHNVFVNEVLGESSDVGAKLISQTDLVEASKIYGKANKYAEMLIAKNAYVDVAIGVDWGGSTAPYGRDRATRLTNSDSQSYTAIAVVGLRATGKVDVLYVTRLDLNNDHHEEASACIRAWTDVDANKSKTLFCHDYGGAGSIRETLMVQYGLPVKNIMGCCYVSAPQSKMLESRAEGGRVYWSLDKARSLTLLCHAIKAGFVGLPEWESSKRFTTDFLALIEDYIERPGAANILRVIRKPGAPDDIAHAINFATVGLWHRHGYPNFKNIRAAELALDKISASAALVEEDALYLDSIAD